MLGGRPQIMRIGARDTPGHDHVEGALSCDERYARPVVSERLLVYDAGEAAFV
jgi:hypothetical protein